MTDNPSTATVSSPQASTSAPAIRHDGAYVVSIIGLVLAAMALPCAIFGFGLYALFVSGQWHSNPAAAFADPFFLAALVGTLLPTVLSGAALFSTIKREERIAATAAVGASLGLISVLVVLGFSFG